MNNQSLSCAAQAVMEAATENPIIQQDPVYRECIGRALRAAADQVISDVTPPIDDYDEYSVGSAATHRKYRRQFLAIAAELEGSNAQI